MIVWPELNLEGFEQFLIKKEEKYGFITKHYVLKFPNNYGASIVTGPAAYSIPKLNKFWEVALIYFPYKGSHKYDLIYDEDEFSDDVKGYLTNEETLRILSYIFNKQTRG